MQDLAREVTFAGRKDDGCYLGEIHGRLVKLLEGLDDRAARDAEREGALGLDALGAAARELREALCQSLD